MVLYDTVAPFLDPFFIPIEDIEVNPGKQSTNCIKLLFFFGA